MPDLIWFEWKRQLKGYRLETIDLDWFIREKVTDFMGCSWVFRVDNYFKYFP